MPICKVGEDAFMTNDDSQLDELFKRYRAACPDVEPQVNFMPEIWQKIETRHSFSFLFRRLARTAFSASAALCLLLLVLNLISSQQAHLLAPTYVDALMADHTAEKTYYTEAIRSIPSGESTKEASPSPHR
jgi:hypothetical protein